jgi:hypothetical protein
MIVIVAPSASGGIASATDGTPIGTIYLWYGTSSNIPSGYEICNGSNGTPDLRNKFVYGASTSGDLKTTGGASTHTHAGSVASGGIHNHTVTGTTSTASTGVNVSSFTSENIYVCSKSSHSHSFSLSSGNEGAHTHLVNASSSVSNVPIYKKLYYIMRIR